MEEIPMDEYSPRAEVTVGERDISLTPSSSLRRRHLDSEVDQTSTPFMEHLYESIKSWFPMTPIRTRDQLYYNMILTNVTVEETIVKSSTLAANATTSTEIYFRQVPCYIIPVDHPYYQIFKKNWSTEDIYAQYHTGNDHGLLVIPKSIIDVLVEDVWIYLKQAGRLSLPNNTIVS